MTTHSTRNSQIATIKIAVKQLGMDDGTYRDMLWTIARVRSAKDLDWAGRKKVIDHLVIRGVVIKSSPKRKGAPKTLGRVAQLQKIEAQLSEMGLTWSYAEAIAENITGGKTGGIQKLAWVRESKHLQGIIAALAYEKIKRGLLIDVDRMLKGYGKTREDVTSQISPNYKKDWTRDINALRWVIDSMPIWWMEQ